MLEASQRGNGLVHQGIEGQGGLSVGFGLGVTAGLLAFDGEGQGFCGLGSSSRALVKSASASSKRPAAGGGVPAAEVGCSVSAQRDRPAVFFERFGGATRLHRVSQLDQAIAGDAGLAAEGLAEVSDGLVVLVDRGEGEAAEVVRHPEVGAVERESIRSSRLRLRRNPAARAWPGRAAGGGRSGRGARPDRR